MLGSKDYVKKEAKVLDQIAGTLKKLDEALERMEGAGKEKARESEQRRALDDIQRLMKESKKLDRVRGVKLADESYGTEEDYARQNKALRDIEELCGGLRAEVKTLEVGTAPPNNETDMSLEDALMEIRQILRTAGRYDTPAEDRRDRIIPSR